MDPGKIENEKPQLQLSLTPACDIIPESVVLIRHAYFQYKRGATNNILNDFSMRVPKGLM